MRTVAIPTTGSKGMEDMLFGHFGKAPTFTLVNLETGGLTIIDNTSDHMGGEGSPPELIRSVGADTVATGHLGAKAAERCGELGITVLCGASGTVRDVLEQLRSGMLSAPSPATMCKHQH
ncbi:MAG: NifB/NifX family molybdenum-iron cluster-binding protein [Methanomassiliicoccus sp.]|nr:NifB/NifX family molybdenum-iron cluster-binding protein [Methanomassiliicoccus sp.]